MAVATITVRPAAGPETETAEPPKIPMTIPPIIPARIPEERGALDAKAMPKQSGSATRNTTTEARISVA